MHNQHYSKILFLSLICPLIWIISIICKTPHYYLLSYSITICWFIYTDYLYELLYTKYVKNIQKNENIVIHRKRSPPHFRLLYS